jgi:hypothetical protein
MARHQGAPERVAHGVVVLAAANEDADGAGVGRAAELVIHRRDLEVGSKGLHYFAGIRRGTRPRELPQYRQYRGAKLPTAPRWERAAGVNCRSHYRWLAGLVACCCWCQAKYPRDSPPWAVHRCPMMSLTRYSTCALLRLPRSMTPCSPTTT